MSSLLTTPFGATTTAAEVIDGLDLTGRRAIVTGGASGIGVETARALAGAGAEVTLAVRKLDVGRQVADEIRATAPGARVEVSGLDLADQLSIANFAASWRGPLHILVNNAGVMASPEIRIGADWELQFATNHYGHFALAIGLHDALVAAEGARVVSVSSSAHLRAGVDFDDIHFRRRPYDPWLAYGQSKTANVLFAVEAARRWADEGIVVNALMPGGIRTNLQRYVSEETLEAMRNQASGPAPSWKTVEQGAATSVLLAASPLVDGITGRYFEDCAEASISEPGTRRGVAAYALDPVAAERLWHDSLETLRLAV